jgi:hypothetical protein
MVTAFLATGGDIFLLNINSLKQILGAGFASLLPVILRYLNSNDVAFGRTKKDEA